MASARNAFVLVLVWQAAAVAAPALNRIEPPAAQQGSEIEITISGTELDEPQELFFEDGRITATAIATDKENVVKATLSIPADCPLGPHRMRVRTAEGLSELRVFHVHGSEQAPEKEPNNDHAAAMPVAMGTAVWGSLGNEDIDIYSIHLPAGTRIAAVVEAVALEQQMLDPHLELVDADGFTIAACDDHPLLEQDAAIAATVEKEGDYFLRIRETAYGGGNALYLLHVGDFPIPHAAWPPGAALGGPLDVEWLGDPAGPFTGQATLVAPGLDGVCRVRPSRDGRQSPVAVPFRATTAPVVIETDAGKEPEKAIKTTAPCAIAGRMDASDDVDWFRIEAPKGSKWKVTGWGRRLGSPVDLVVNIHRDDAQRQRITGNDDAGGPDSMVQVTVPDEGAFLVRVNDFQRRGGGEFVYWIDVEPLAPNVVVSVPPAQTKTQQRLVVAVPRGNRMALFFNATRTECGDPVKPDFAGLPSGVTALTAAFEQPAPGGLVVFEAAPDAAVGTTMTSVRVLRGEGNAAAAVGGLLQGTELVYGDPNREPYRIALGDRLAVAVVEEAPVVLELDPPSVPIARRGLLDLKVKVHRAEGFTGKVRLELPFKPPGIAASVVDVKEGETEVRFPISAAADAPVKDWQIAVAASLVPDAATKKEERQARRAGRGSWISTRPVPLSVIEPMVDLTAEKAQVEQGSQTTLVFKTSKPAAFEGKAKVTLLGLPAKAEAPVLELESGKESIEFPVTVAADAPAGKHDNIFCRIEVPKGDAWVIHQTAATSLRIDKPLPPDKAKEGGS
ncbi:MAG: PPC domain-containing protein [Planctomycetia bacterium]